MLTTDVILHIPDQRGSVSENDSDLQDIEETEDSSDSPDSSLVAIEQEEDSAENSDIQNFGISEADKDEEQSDDIVSVGSTLKRRETIASALFFKSYFKRTKQDVDENTAGTVIQLKCIKEASPPVPIDFFSNSAEWTLEPHELDVSKEYELIIGISIKSTIRVFDIRKVILTVNQTDERWYYQKYSISESGHYLATYSASSIELWDLTSGLQPTIAQQPTKSASLPPRLCGRTRPLCTSATDFEDLSLSISWDGSQLTTSGGGSPFKLYGLNRQESILEYSSKAENMDLITFEGRGIFHRGTGSQGQDPEKEIFVAVYQDTIEIYSVYGSWNRLRIIHHTSPITSDCVLEGWPVGRDMGNTIQGRRFISWNIDLEDDVICSILIWDLDSGRLLCTIEAAGHNMYDNGSLSSDGSLLVEEIDGEIVRYCAHTGVRIDTSGASIGGVVPIRGGNSLLRTSDGLVRTGKDLIPIYPSCKLPESVRVLSISKNGELFTAL
ncbi:hypothetical protein BGX20_008179 [Mortierella sp. AD010]|nr:hypothetical protein BGX20_008179 [Mortierella sp. AD010]